MSAKRKNPAAVALGRKGGKSKSQSKSTASRKNIVKALAALAAKRKQAAL